MDILNELAKDVGAASGGKTTKPTKSTKATKTSKAGTGSGGGLGDILGNLGNLGSFSSLVGPLMAMLSNGGLGNLLDALKSMGLGSKTDSWIGKGPNKAITPAQAGKAMGKDKVQQLAAQSGLPESEVLQGLSKLLPGVVNQLTPNGQMPALGELESAIGGLLGSFGK